MKKCTQCTQVLSDDTKFCFKCGGANFEPVVESGGTYQQPTYQQPTQQPPQQSYYTQQPAYQQPAYQQQPYQSQPGYINNEPATIGNFIVFWLLMLVPIFNIVYMIMVAVGGPKYKPSMTNYARATLILAGIGIVLSIIMAIAGVSILGNLFGSSSYYY